MLINYIRDTKSGVVNTQKCYIVVKELVKALVLKIIYIFINT